MSEANAMTICDYGNNVTI